MGIGTSLGAYFETDLDHHSGNETVPEVMKPKDTGDDNVIPPDEGSYDKSLIVPIQYKQDAQLTPSRTPLESGVKQAELDRIASQPSNIGPDEQTSVVPQQSHEDSTDVALREISRVLDRPELPAHTGSFANSRDAQHEAGIQSFVTELQGIQTDYQQNGETFTPHGIREGEGLEAYARRTIPHPDEEAAMFQQSLSELPGLPVRNPYRQEPFDPQDVGRDYRNFHERLPPDAMNDHAFYRWGEYQAENSMTPEQEDRWVRLDEAEGARIASPHEGRTAAYHSLGVESPEEWGARFRREQEESVRSFHEERQANIQNLKDAFEESKDKKKLGSVSLMDDPRTDGAKNRFVFQTDAGQVGEIHASLRKDGREIRVHGLYGISGNANDFGKSEMKSLFRLVAKEYPTAEYVTGFRVSGARGNIGRPNEARMRIPGRTQTVKEDDGLGHPPDWD